LVLSSKIESVKQQKQVSKETTNMTDTSGSESEVLINLNYSQLMNKQLVDYPFKDFARSVSDDYRWNFKDARRGIDAVATSIALKGAPYKSTFTSGLGHRLENLVVQIAAARADKPVLFLDPLLDAKDLEEALKFADPGSFIFQPKVHKTVQLEEIYKVFPFLKTADDGTVLNDTRFPNLRYIFHTSKTKLNGLTWLKDFPLYDVTDHIKRISTTINVHAPKTFILNKEKRVVSLSQYNIINTGYLTGSNIGANHEDYVFSSIPLHFSPGLSLGAGLVLSQQAKFIFCSDIFDVDETAEVLKVEGVTLLIGFPQHFEEILQSKKKFPNLKKAIVVTMPDKLPNPNLLQRIKTDLELDVVSLTFGTQETGGVISQSVNNFSPNNVGKPLSFTKIKIVDQKGSPVSVGKSGELLVQGWNVMSGYKNDVESTNKKISGGFLRTGVKAKLDNNGNIILDI